MTIAYSCRGLKVKVKGQANAIGLMSIQSSFFLVFGDGVFPQHFIVI